MSGPLDGVRVVEFEGIGPAPYCAMLLSDLGADVVRVARPKVDRGPMIPDKTMTPMERGRRIVTLDLKAEEGRAAALALLAASDACVEGLRPGVMERLGLGPEQALAANPRLVYCRITGWGQEGPWARTAGHDLNYIALSGALAAMGEPGRPPTPPLNLVGDYGGGGLFAAFGLVSAVLSAQRTGQGQVVDAAMVDGAASQMTLMYALYAQGDWTRARGENLLDGGAPFYRCYTCSDGKFLSVGAIEPQFFRLMMEEIGLDPANWDQTDRARWPDMADAISSQIALRSRDEWAEVFDGTDACIAPVLDVAEAPSHPHNAARGTFSKAPSNPSPGPRFSATPSNASETTHEDFGTIISDWLLSDSNSKT